MFAKFKGKKPGLSFWLFLIFIILVIKDKVFNYQGHYAFDDMAYAELAFDFFSGDFTLLESHYAYRWALIFPLAIFYKIFGINDFSSCLPAVLSYLSICAIIYSIFKKDKNWIFIYAIILFSIQKWNYNYIDKIMPDIMVSLGFLASLFCIHKLYFGGIKNRFLPLFFSASILFAFAAKETILLLFPVYAVLLIFDVYKKRNLGFWGLSLLSGMLLGLGYFGLIYFLTGNPLERFEQIANNSYENPCSYDLLPIENTISRISFELLFEWLKSGLLIWVILSLLIFFTKLKQHYFSFKHPLQFWSFCLILSLLCSNFMSISFKAYVPLCPDPRHYIFLAPIVAICMAFTVRYFMRKRYTSDIFFLIISNTAFSLMLMIVYGEKVIPFLIILSTAIVALLRYAWKIHRNHSLILGAIILFIFTSYGRGGSGYVEQKSFIQKEIIGKIDKGIILTNNAQSRLGNYHLAFDESQFSFKAYEEISDLKNTENVYILLNAYSCELNGTPWAKLPKYVQEHRKKENELAQDKSSRLYRLDLKIMNDFPYPDPN